MPQLTDLLRAAPPLLAQKRAVCGFDGFADRILRPIRSIEGENLTYFDTIGEFGAFLQEKQGKSCSIELDIQTRKIGGNCPIFSAALGACAVQTDCIGMFTGGAFEDMPPACTRYSYADVGTSDCMEFRDGKVMLAARCTMAGDPFARVCAAVPHLAEKYARADLAAFLNWSELAYAPALWDAVQAQIFAALPADFNKFVFFDLCDIARKSATEIEGVLALLGRFARTRRTVLSLNENECLLLAAIVGGGEDLERIARAAAQKHGIHEIVVHTLRQSYVLADNIWHVRPTIFCEKPLLSTGAGDNFNAGYCLGLLLTGDPAQRLALANLTASRYITSGKNFDIPGLTAYAESL